MALQFPLDIQDTKYEAKVRFQPFKLKSVDVAAVLRADGSISFDQFEGVDPGLRRAIVNQAAKSHDGEDTAVQTLPGTNQQGEAVGQSCTLFLPQAVQITDAAAYENIDLGIVGASTEAALNAGEALAPALLSSAAGAVESFVDAITGNSPLGTPVGRLAVSRAANKIPSDAARGAVRSATRTVVNPNTRALFKSIPLREFTFNFKMIPTSRKETEEIKNIVKFFRTELYPEVINIKNIPAGYEFPNVFGITMFYKDQRNTLATKILPSYLRNFSATYNSSSMGFLEGGDFTEVDISMSFVESTTLHKKLVQEGF